MTILVTGPVVQPQPVFDKIFIAKVSMTQDKDKDDKKAPTCKWVVDYILYGVDADDNRVYEGKKIETVKFTDEGQALGNLEAAIAAELESDKDIDTATVV